MLSALSLFCAGVATVIFFQYNGPEIVKNTILDRYTRFNKLNKFVKHRYNNRCRAFYVTCEIIGKSLYLSFVQWLNNSVKHIDKNTYTVNYILKGRKYTMLVKPSSGPPPILLVFDENGDDVTDKVVPYIGPQNDFHGQTLTPDFFGVKQLNFETSMGDTLLFEQGEKLTI